MMAARKVVLPSIYNAVRKKEQLLKLLSSNRSSVLIRWVIVSTDIVDPLTEISVGSKEFSHFIYQWVREKC